MNTKILTQFKSRFLYPPTNWERVKYLWQNDLPLTFYSWECPPRQIEYDEKYGRWVNFDVDIKKVVNGKKIDRYTEVPRIVTKSEMEKWIINELVLKNPNCRYIKMVTDTNGLYLYPKSKTILGVRKITSLSKIFINELRKRAEEIFGLNRPNFYLYTSFQKNYKNEYENYFNLVMSKIQTTKNYVPGKTIKAWEDCLINHVGFNKTNELNEQRDVLNRVIASYCAEGMLFDLLNQDQQILNPVWINWEDSPDMAETTQILRNKFGLDTLPIVYLK